MGWPTFGKDGLPCENESGSPTSRADHELAQASAHYDNGDIELFRLSLQLSEAYLLRDAEK